MKKALQILGVIVAILVIVGLGGAAYLYLTYCGGHPHGMC